MQIFHVETIIGHNKAQRVFQSLARQLKFRDLNNAY